MSLNIPNLDKLIAHLEAQPPERINMANYSNGELSDHACGTCGCIAGWAIYLREGSYDVVKYTESETENAASYLGIDDISAWHLFFPYLHAERSLYPARRVIATLKRLRDRFLATGEIVVDWGPEPGSEPAQSWAAPRAVEIKPPALPETLTRLLAAQPAPTATEA